MDTKSTLIKAIEIQNHAAQYGFEWKQVEPIFEKLEEEVAELKEAITIGTESEITSELGDVLFVIANLARILKNNPDNALEKTNTKFNNRFNYVLNSLDITDFQHTKSKDDMRHQWQLSKKVFP